jgi:hypothetical protein
MRSFSVNFKTVMISFSSTRPVGAWLKNDRSVSRALRASSWVGEPGTEELGGDCNPFIGVVELGGPMRELLLLLWWSGGEEIEVSMV